MILIFREKSLIKVHYNHWEMNKSKLILEYINEYYNFKSETIYFLLYLNNVFSIVYFY